MGVIQKRQTTGQAHRGSQRLLMGWGGENEGRLRVHLFCKIKIYALAIDRNWRDVSSHQLHHISARDMSRVFIPDRILFVQ